MCSTCVGRLALRAALLAFVTLAAGMQDLPDLLNQKYQYNYDSEKVTLKHHDMLAERSGNPSKISEDVMVSKGRIVRVYLKKKLVA